MSSISSEAKVGLFVLVGLIILGYMSVQVGKQSFGLKKGYTLEVVFDSAAGLNRDASVQIAGVEVGQVEAITLKDGKALVRLRITPGVKLEKDAIASIKTHGILSRGRRTNLPDGAAGRHRQNAQSVKPDRGRRPRGDQFPQPGSGRPGG
jgi:phospholipid/cholesterol/gamma-HCH transport system substrate-binding protein